MSSRRNLIILLAHGLRSDAIGDSNTWPLRTPYLEKLADRGLRLVASTACPADCGGLVTLLTGLHARQHGYIDQSSAPMRCEGWPALLADAGYHTVGVGCVAAMQPWLTESVLVTDLDAADVSRCTYVQAMHAKGHGPAIEQQRKQRVRCGPFEPDRLILEPDEDIDGFIAAQAKEKLEHMPTDKPWALIVVFSGPGNDLAPPMLYDELIDPAILEAGFTPPDFTRLDVLAELDYPRVMLQRLEPPKLGRIRSDYLGRVGLIDHGVGRLMTMLEERPDRQRTWTLLTSDRGYLLGEHGLVGHRSFLSAAVEVPVVLAPPTKAPDTTADALVSTVDVAATIADMAGVDLPKACSGRSLLQILRGEPFQSPLGGACLSEFGRRLMLETERYKVIFDIESRNAIGLYDMLNDPDERTNLLLSVVGRNLLDALRWRLGDALLQIRAQPMCGP